MSEPVASGAVPEASAAAEPPELPPTARPASHGLRVTPQSRVCVVAAQEYSGVAVWAWTIPPASMIRCANGAVSVATTSRCTSDP